MKINDRVERIFSHAAALQQSGRLRNTIYCDGTDIYIINQDQTVFIRFRTKPNEAVFKHSVSFAASDYDSKVMKEVDGRVVFVQKDGDCTRTKSCSTPGRTTADVAGMFRGLGRPKGDPVLIPERAVKLLDDSLSHVEIRGEGGSLKIVQRNIYNGTIVEVTRKIEGLAEKSVHDFDPAGLRTNDLLALYSFVDGIKFWFGDDVAHFKSEGGSLEFTGIISRCVYDQLGGALWAEKAGNQVA